jgi:signal transduction histidine kinase
LNLRICLLVAGQAALAAGLAVALVAVDARTGLHLGSPGGVVAFAAAFVLVGLLPMHLELGRSACTVTLAEAVMVIALLTCDPVGAVVAAVVGEAVACLIHRQSALKVAYNTIATASSVLLGATVTAALSHGGHVWWGALAGVACYAVLNQVSTSAVLRLVEQRRFLAVFRASAAMAAVATVVSSSIGLAAGALYDAHPAAPMLLVPLVLAVALETRRVAAHRAERLRFERLYAASGRTAGLQAFTAALAVSAAEARNLVTGVSAVCCAPDRNGVWHGMLVDDRGSRPAKERVVAAVVDLIESHGAAEVMTGAVAPELRAVLPTFSGVVVAGSADADAGTPVALAVFRDIRGDDQREARSAVLAAFVGHAALTATNARLYEEVEDALRRQVDLNRQKDDFLAAVSHELRTPLASVLGSLATLRRLEDRMTAETKDGLYDMASQEGKRLQRLIEELLLIAALDGSEELAVKETVDLGHMLTELADELGELAGDRLVVAVAPGAETVLADTVKLRQILVNLVENAAKYAPEGRIKLLAWPPATTGRVAVTVIDHGPGIPADQRERVFERFVQLDQTSTRTRGGTGLGLYLCRRLAQILDTTLTLTETPGGGCTFSLELDAPVTGETPAPAAPGAVTEIAPDVPLAVGARS